MDERWVRFYCACGHHAVVKLPDGPWQHRDKLLPRAVCTVCGRKAAVDLKTEVPPGVITGRFSVQ